MCYSHLLVHLWLILRSPPLAASVGNPLNLQCVYVIPTAHYETPILILWISQLKRHKYPGQIYVPSIHCHCSCNKHSNERKCEWIDINEEVILLVFVLVPYFVTLHCSGLTLTFVFKDYSWQALGILCVPEMKLRSPRYKASILHLLYFSSP